jgi:hypothetical protein
MKRMGRPAPIGGRRKFEVHVRVNRVELRQIVANVKASGLSLSEFFRTRVLARTSLPLPGGSPGRSARRLLAPLRGGPRRPAYRADVTPLAGL